MTGVALIGLVAGTTVAQSPAAQFTPLSASRTLPRCSPARPARLLTILADVFFCPEENGLASEGAGRNISDGFQNRFMRMFARTDIRATRKRGMNTAPGVSG